MSLSKTGISIFFFLNNTNKKNVDQGGIYERVVKGKLHHGNGY
jgi:hypothetical protein